MHFRTRTPALSVNSIRYHTAPRGLSGPQGGPVELKSNQAARSFFNEGEPECGLRSALISAAIKSGRSVVKEVGCYRFAQSSGFNLIK